MTVTMEQERQILTLFREGVIGARNFQAVGINRNQYDRIIHSRLTGVERDEIKARHRAPTVVKPTYEQERATARAALDAVLTEGRNLLPIKPWRCTDMSDWQPIDENTPRDGTKIFLYHQNWPVAYKAHWDWVEGGDDGFCAWFLEDENGGAMGDGQLWPEEDHMPTHWAPVPPTRTDTADEPVTP